jgi:D-methionine transport system substrate-binding protein
VDLDVRVSNDYVQPNDQLVQKQVDANYFQTEPTWMPTTATARLTW